MPELLDKYQHCNSISEFLFVIDRRHSNICCIHERWNQWTYFLILCILFIFLIVQMFINNDDVWPPTGHNIRGAGIGLYSWTRGFDHIPHWESSPTSAVDSMILTALIFASIGHKISFRRLKWQWPNWWAGGLMTSVGGNSFWSQRRSLIRDSGYSAISLI